MVYANDLFSRGLRIPRDSIDLAALIEYIRTQLYLPIGVYGTAKYGRAIYAANYGQYGGDVYEDASYY